MNILNNGNSKKERWAYIDDFNYSVSNYGRVRNDLTGLILKPQAVGKNQSYLAVRFWPHGEPKQKQYLIHRLVAKAFIPNPENKKCVNHKDFNTHNNNITNLEWSTHAENTQHGVDAGHFRYKFHRVTENFTPEQIAEINSIPLKTRFGMKRLASKYGIGVKMLYAVRQSIRRRKTKEKKALCSSSH